MGPHSGAQRGAPTGLIFCDDLCSPPKPWSGPPRERRPTAMASLYEDHQAYCPYNGPKHIWARDVSKQWAASEGSEQGRRGAWRNEPDQGLEGGQSVWPRNSKPIQELPLSQLPLSHLRSCSQLAQSLQHVTQVDCSLIRQSASHLWSSSEDCRRPARPRNRHPTLPLIRQETVQQASLGSAAPVQSTKSLNTGDCTWSEAI